MSPPFYIDTSHFKVNHNISLFNKSVIEITAVHACVGRSADSSGRWIQPLNLRSHVLIGCCRHIDSVTVFIFEYQFKKHENHPLVFSAEIWYNCIKIILVEGSMNKEDILKIIKKSDIRSPVPIEYLNKLENEFNVLFPEDFKFFYSQISNGMRVSPNRRDEHELGSIEDIFKLLHEKEKKSKTTLLDKPFPFQKAYIWEDDYEQDALSRMKSVRYGNIEIGDIYCSESWHLILNGSSYGTMWGFTQFGIAPCHLTFIQWFKLWYLNKTIKLDINDN